MKQGDSFRSKCGHARVQFDPKWSLSKPYSTFAHGSAGLCFASQDEAVRHLTDVGFRFPKRSFDIVWSPEGRTIAVVSALTGGDAKRLTPMPWKRFMGEVYAQEHVCNQADTDTDTDTDTGRACRYCNKQTNQETTTDENR